MLTPAWIDAPESLVALLYVLLGWVGAVFGYHEIFHALVVAAAALQYAAIAFFVLPGARE